MENIFPNFPTKKQNKYLIQIKNFSVTGTNCKNFARKNSRTQFHTQKNCFIFSKKIICSKTAKFAVESTNSCYQSHEQIRNNRWWRQTTMHIVLERTEENYTIEMDNIHTNHRRQYTQSERFSVVAEFRIVAVVVIAVCRLARRSERNEKKDVIKSSDRIRMWNVGNKNPNATSL